MMQTLPAVNALPNLISSPDARLGIAFPANRSSLLA